MNSFIVIKNIYPQVFSRRTCGLFLQLDCISKKNIILPRSSISLQKTYIFIANKERWLIIQFSYKLMRKNISKKHQIGFKII